MVHVGPPVLFPGLRETFAAAPVGDWAETRRDQPRVSEEPPVVSADSQPPRFLPAARGDPSSSVGTDRTERWGDESDGASASGFLFVRARSLQALRSHPT